MEIGKFVCKVCEAEIPMEVEWVPFKEMFRADLTSKVAFLIVAHIKSHASN